jgi:glycosyltransferase EpsF
MNTLSVFSLYAAKRAGVPVRIAHSHSTAAPGEGLRNVMKYTLRPFSRVFATQYMACSSHAGEWLFGKKVSKAGKVMVLPNAVEYDKWRFNPEARERVRKQYGIEDKLVVGHVGRFMWQKNHEFLIKVFAEVHEKHSDSVLMLIGDGSLQNKIKEQVKALGIIDSVLFLGVRNDVPDLMSAMDVFCLPSKFEGFAVVRIEAQASGMSAVMSAVMSNEPNGVWEQSVLIGLDEDPRFWAETLIREAEAARANPETRLDKGAVVAKHFAITKTVKALTDQYSSSQKSFSKDQFLKVEI